MICYFKRPSEEEAFMKAIQCKDIYLALFNFLLTDQDLDVMHNCFHISRLPDLR